MDVLEAIQNRRTARSFNKVPVEFDKISLILEAGTHAPSSGNLQNWKFIVVTNKKEIKEIHNYCLDQVWMSEAPVLIIVCALPEKVENKFGLRGERLYSVQNIAACTENMLLTAHALELGAAWVGAFDEDKIRSIFSIPEEARPQSIIALGYSDYEYPEKIMQPLESQVYFNSYGTTIKHLNRTLKEYNKDVQRITAQVSENANEAVNSASKFLKEKFEIFKQNVQDLLELK